MGLLRLSLLSLAVLAVMQGPHADELRADRVQFEATGANPLVGTWRSTERSGAAGREAITFITFAEDGRYRMRVHFGRAQQIAGVQMIEGVYTVVRPGRLTFEPREGHACPSGSNCVPYPLDASVRQPQAISFRMSGPNSFVESNGTVWQRVR
jgi:hypothetical protein